MAIAGTVALFLYDASRKSFHKGENATEQQQAVRIAFDKLASDVRMAGFNANPDGELEFPDDFIEAAFDTAVSFRADFDAEDPADSLTPETQLSGGAHRAVSVGNDEIVAYVLAKPDGSSPDTLVFDADVREVPRDGASETVRIPGVALIQDDPPYTLYRITLSSDPTSWGGAGFVVRTPLVENVRSMTFRYHAAGGQALNAAFDLSSTSEDIGGSDAPASRRRRGAIRRIEIQLEGLTRDPDLGWEDRTDANPSTRSYRKFHLRGDVTPRNIGRKGLQDLGWDVTPPSKPGAPEIVAGHCEGLWIEWPPNPEADRVAAYRVTHVAADGTGRGVRTLSATGFYLDGLTHGLEYRVTVQAVDAAGNWSAPSEERSARVVDVNFPEPPLHIVATTGRPGEIRLTWDPVTENTSSEPSADPASPAIRDLEGYKVYRGLREDFTMSEPSSVTVASETVLRPSAAPSLSDTDVVPCRTYYYRVLAVDLCDMNNDTGYDAPGHATAAAPPAPPLGVSAVRSGSSARVDWEPVGRDTDGNPAHADTYNVFRQVLGPGDLPSDCTPENFRGTASGSNTFLDDSPPVPPPGGSVVYRVQATNDCHSNDVSECSAPASLRGCSFSGEVVLTSPRGGLLASPVDVEVRVRNGLDSYRDAAIFLRRESDGDVLQATVTSPNPVWRYRWSPASSGTYLVKAIVTNASGCSSFAAVRVRVGG
jgi:hypothetical protein